MSPREKVDTFGAWTSGFLAGVFFVFALDVIISAVAR